MGRRNVVFWVVFVDKIVVKVWKMHANVPRKHATFSGFIFGRTCHVGLVALEPDDSVADVGHGLAVASIFD